MPEVWTPPLIVVVAMCVALYGFSKTAMPVAGTLASPVLAAALGATIAAGFAIPLLIVGDFFALAMYRQHADWPVIRRLIPGVLVGFALTVVLFRFADPFTIGRVLGLLILVSVVLEIVRLRAERGLEDLPVNSNRVSIAFLGTLTGMTTMGLNAGGPAMTLYLVSMRVPMLVFMGTATWFFFVLNAIKVPLLVGLDLISWATLRVDLAFVPALILGVAIGRFTFRRITATVFVRVALVLSAIAAAYLIVVG